MIVLVRHASNAHTIPCVFYRWRWCWRTRCNWSTYWTIFL